MFTMCVFVVAILLPAEHWTAESQWYLLPHHCFNYCAGRCGCFSNTCCPARIAVLTLRVRPILLYPILEVSFRKLHNASNQITEQTRKEMTYWNMNMYELKDCTCTNLCRCATQVGVDCSCLCDRSIWSCGERICLLYTWSAWIKGSSQVLRVYNLLWGLTQMSHPESELSSDRWVFWWRLHWLLCADWQMGARIPHRSHPGEWRAGGGEKGLQSALLVWQ